MDNQCSIVSVEQLISKKPIKLINQANGTFQETTIEKHYSLSIPKYQREIRWKENNVSILIRDLINEAKFLGIIFVRLNANDNTIEIIDGQQRLTTFYLILKYIDAGQSSFDYRLFDNQTYAKLDKMISYNFDFSIITNPSERDQIKKSDILEQTDSFKRIWDTIIKEIGPLDNLQKQQFRNKLLDSNLCLISSSQGKEKTYVQYYLDLNDKSVSLDYIDILKARLFELDYGNMTNKWIQIQEELRRIKDEDIKYDQFNFFYHFFSCEINRYLNYVLTELKPDMKLKKRQNIDGHYYPSGTYLLKVINNTSFFTELPVKMIKIINFIVDVKKSNISKYEDILKNKKCDSVTIKCVFECIKNILLIEDEVPKILIMKYYLDIIDNPLSEKKDIQLIFYIYLYSILFAFTKQKKGSTELINVVLSQDWKDKLKKASTKLWYLDNRKKINYFKSTYKSKEKSYKIGQYLPKNIYVLNESVSGVSGNISFNQKKLFNALTNRITAEHFFINNSKKVEFKYGSTNKTAFFVIPKKLCKLISYPANYLYIDEDTNSKIGNKTIKEKIDIINSKIGEHRNVFPIKENQNYFDAIVKEFNLEKENFPNLSCINKIGQARKAIKNFYLITIEKLMQKSVDEYKKTWS